MNIYLPIEVKIRELEGKTLLALEAAERGHVVIIGKKKDTLNLAKAGKLPPGIVHDKSFTPGAYKIDNFNVLKEHGHLITGQDEESGLLDESFDDFAKRRFSKETVELADKVFAWGPHDADSLRKIYHQYQEKIIPTGSPRVDFWRTEFDSFFKDGYSGSKPDVLIVSNFGYPIDENPFWNRIARLRKAGYFERDPGMEKYMYENSAYQYRLLFHFVEMIRALSKKMPDINILVRPHPVEAEDAWEKLIGDLSNVTVERKGTISNLIRNTSVLIHNGCTSALEAAVSGVPRIAYRPIPDDLEREIPNNTSLHAFTIDEVIQDVIALLKEGDLKDFEEVKNVTDKILKSRLSSIEGRFASEKIVDEWEELNAQHELKQAEVDELKEILEKEEKENRLLKFKNKLKIKAVDIRNFVTGQTRADSGSGNLLKTTHKFPHLYKEEIDSIIENIQKSLDRFHTISSIQYGEHSYIIYKN